MGADFENKAHEKHQIKFLTVLATMKLMKWFVSNINAL
jgi:hypothetical protein